MRFGREPLALDVGNDTAGRLDGAPVAVDIDQVSSSPTTDEDGDTGIEPE